ncbi:MAG: DUF92 domain-containing protein [Candidatus Thermoplasmatota archaeon]|nr:DUF92 domain-containing protein [Candidatus Thermoplasmatota archaeon]
MDLVIGIVACTLFSIFSYLTDILDRKGAIVSFFLGLLVFFCSDLYWLLLLIFFVLICYIATIAKKEEKVKRHWSVKDSIRGENNVVANGIVPIAIAALSFINSPVMGLCYITAIAAATSDTFASELGILSNDTYLITTLKRTRVGTDGGISLLGELSALLGAFIIALLGWLLIFRLDPGYAFRSLFYPTVFGFFGCQIDSFLGAIFERRRRLSKGEVNFLSIALATLTSAPFYLL